MAIVFSNDNSKLYLPFEVAFYSVNSRGDKYGLQTVTTFTSNQYDLVDSGVDLLEYRNVWVELNCSETNAEVFIMFTDMEELEDKKIYPNTKECLYEFQNENEFIWAPGRYCLKVFYNGNDFYTLFNIKPRNMEMIELDKLKETIDSKAIGLSLDIRNRVSGDYSIGTIATLPSFYETCAFFLVKGKLITRYFYNIINKPFEEISYNYEERRDLIKLTSQGIRWLTSAKGISKNQNIYTPTVVYQKINRLTLKNKENTIFIHIISYFLLKLNWVKNILEKHETIIDNQLMEADNEIYRLSTEYSKLIKDNQKRYDLNEAINKRKREIEWKSKKVSDNIRKIDAIREELRKISKLSAFLSSIYNTEIYESNISGDSINIKPSQRLYSMSNYRNIYYLYKKLKSMNKHTSVQNGIYRFKKSCLLYEYYCYIMTIDVLLRNGFEWKAGLFGNEDEEQYYINEIPEGTTVQVEDSEYRLSIVYNEEIKFGSFNKRHLIDGHYCTVTGCSVIPDIRIDIYHKETNSFRHTIILEVKYRKFKSLWYEGDFTTKVMEQFDRYLSNIEYKGKNNGNVNNKPVKKVIILYPKDTLADPFRLENVDRFLFLQLSPGDKNEHWGEDIFVKSIISEIYSD